jgi:hypothetical protein
VKLLVGAMQKALFGEEFALGLRHERDVHGGRLMAPAQLNQAGGQPGANVRRLPRRHQQASPRCRRKRHRDLKLRIIRAAGALVGLGPAAVEHVLAA